MSGPSPVSTGLADDVDRERPATRQRAIDWPRPGSRASTATSRPAGGLRVVQDVARAAGIEPRSSTSNVAAEVLRVGPCRRRGCCLRRQSRSTPSSSGTPSGVDLDGHAAGGGHLGRVADQPEARSRRCTHARTPAGSASSASLAARFSVTIDASPRSTSASRRPPELDRRGDDARCRAASSGAGRRRVGPRRSSRSARGSTSPVTA